MHKAKTMVRNQNIEHVEAGDCRGGHHPDTSPRAVYRTPFAACVVNDLKNKIASGRTAGRSWMGNSNDDDLQN